MGQLDDIMYLGRPCEPLAHPSQHRGAQGPGWADSSTRSLRVSTSRCPLERGPRGVSASQHHRPSHSHHPTCLPTPKTGQMRTEWRYILKRSYLSLLSRFSVFLFYNPETAVPQPPASAPQCPREQLRREVISQSDEWRPGRQAGRHRGQSKAVQITKKGKETLPVAALPPIKGSVSLCCSHESSASSEGPSSAISVSWCPHASQHSKAETKRVPRHAIQFT